MRRPICSVPCERSAALAASPSVAFAAGAEGLGMVPCSPRHRGAAEGRCLMRAKVRIALMAAMLVTVVAVWLAPAPVSAVSEEPALTASPVSAVCEEPALTALAEPDPMAGPLCQKGYCDDDDWYCAFSGTGPRGCCKYYNCFYHPPCDGPDPLPPDAC
jgi:hypothetical protein